MGKIYLLVARRRSQSPSHVTTVVRSFSARPPQAPPDRRRVVGARYRQIQLPTQNVRPTLFTERFCASGLEPATRAATTGSSNSCPNSSCEVGISRIFTIHGHHTNNAKIRPLSILSQLPSRPTATPSLATHAIAADVPTASFQLPSQPGLALLQVRGAKRDTYDPSHRVRKRRHGFLSRLRSKNGRNTLKRRKLRGRNTLSH